MTIRQYLANQKAKRIAKLKELNAPKAIIDHEESGDGFSHIEGIDKYGDLEMEGDAINLLEGREEDNYVSSIILFPCLNLKYILLTRVLDDSKPYNKEHMGYPGKTILTRMDVSF